MTVEADLIRSRSHAPEYVWRGFAQTGCAKQQPAGQLRLTTTHGNYCQRFCLRFCRLYAHDTSNLQRSKRGIAIAPQT